MGPMSSNGTITGQGNLADEKAMLKMAGNTITTSHRMEFHFSRFFFSEFLFTPLHFLPLWLVRFNEDVRELPAVNSGSGKCIARPRATLHQAPVQRSLAYQSSG